MNFLVIGSGGREHAIARALKFSQTAKNIYAAPGSDGIGELVSVQNITRPSEIAAFCEAKKIDCVVIGPEIPLAEGLSDFLREQKINVFGPSRKAAELESSKIFSKEFMVAAGVPTAQSWVVSSVEETKNAAQKTHAPYVLKADGLAAGKGVYICKDLAALIASARELFENKVLGDAGTRALLEEFSPGYELSYLVLTNGREYEALPLAQDHKRLRDNDEGPNTGGMGTTAPMKISDELDKQIRELVFDRTMNEMQRQNLFFRGVLFVGLMISENKPSVLEFNTRFGDPETQVILPLLDGDWGEVFDQVARGVVPQLRWRSHMFVTCLVLAAENYPENPKKNIAIEGLAPPTTEKYFLHAGTRKTPRGWVTNGGRVLNAVGLATTRQESRARAYELVAQINSAGMQFRKDIGLKNQA